MKISIIDNYFMSWCGSNVNFKQKNPFLSQLNHAIFFTETTKGNSKVESESWNTGRGSEWERCNK